MCVTSFNGDSRLPASKIMHAAINIFSPHSSSAIKQIARRKLNFQTDCISLCICEFYFWWRSSMSQSHKVQVIRLYCITSSPLQSPSQTHITSAFSLCDCLCSDRSHSERVYTSGCGSKKKTTTKSTFVALWFYFFFRCGFCFASAFVRWRFRRERKFTELVASCNEEAVNGVTRFCVDVRLCVSTFKCGSHSSSIVPMPRVATTCVVGFVGWYKVADGGTNSTWMPGKWKWNSHFECDGVSFCRVSNFSTAA